MNLLTFAKKVRAEKSAEVSPNSALPVGTLTAFELYPELRFSGNRAILLDAKDKLPEAELRHCVALALTYHSNRRKRTRAR